MWTRVAIIVLCLAMLTGCWSRRELNEILIVLGVGLDWEEGEYLVSFQVVSPSEISAQKKTGERPPGSLFQGRGKTVFEAARAVTAEAPRKMYFGHLQLYVVSEALAKKGVHDFIDNILRDNELRMDFNLVVARGTRAENVLKLYTPIEKLPTYSMLQSLRNSEKLWAPTVSITMDEVLDRLSGDGYELALTGIQLFGDPKAGDSPGNVKSFLPSRRYRYKGIAVFKGDRLVGWLNEKESKGYTDITDNLRSSTIELPCGSRHYIGIEITSSETKLKADLIEDTPVVTIGLRTEAAVVNMPCKHIDLTDPAAISKLEEESALSIKSNAIAAVKRAKALHSDVFGFGNQLGKDHPAYWKRIRDDWNEKYFPKAEIRYDIKVFIRKTGTTGNTTLKKS